jgi:hypothetical protein
MYASSCVTLAGAAHTSIENSPVALSRSASLRLPAVVPCALPPALMLTPQPPIQVMSPDMPRSSAGSTPLVSNMVLPVPVLNSYLAMVLAS